jgi:hypothetical protein
MGRSTRRSRRQGFISRHSLSLIVVGIVCALVLLFVRADAKTHVGTFYGNAIADWLGTLMIVLGTEFLRESRSAESRRPRPRGRSKPRVFVERHSLTIVLLLSGAVWVWLFARADTDSKPGEVFGNIVSEWSQLLGLVLVTKYAREAGSKEGGTD